MNTATNVTASDKLIDCCDTSAASMAREEYKRTGRATSPYAAYPERETYSMVETYERADGSRYSRTCEISRWGGQYSFGEWIVK